MGSSVELPGRCSSRAYVNYTPMPSLVQSLVDSSSSCINGAYLYFQRWEFTLLASGHGHNLSFLNKSRTDPYKSEYGTQRCDGLHWLRKLISIRLPVVSRRSSASNAHHHTGISCYVCHP